MNQAGLDGVKVHDAHGKPCPGIDHYIAHFRVAVNYPQRQSSVRFGIFQNWRELFAPVYEIHAISQIGGRRARRFSSTAR